MKKLFTYSFIIGLCVLRALPSIAQLKLPPLMSDGMVLQQNSDVRIWGEGMPDSEVTLTTSWTKDVYSARVNPEGDWEIRISTPDAGFEPQQISIVNLNDQQIIENILIGEVWFCSGQSNMEMPLRGFHNCPIEGANRTIATSGQYAERLRYATIGKAAPLTPAKTTTGGEWKTSNPMHAAEFGATAYHFGTLLSDVLNVPVGIINCSWGGSRVEGWLPKETVDLFDDIDYSMIVNDDLANPWLKPMIMYNGLFKPASRYTVKGILWYQGESNVGKPDYAERLAMMAAQWRSDFEDDDLPFYQVEIAPYAYSNNRNETDGALLREQQYKASQIIPNSGIISTNDLVEPYEVNQIHPKDKKNVGERLAYLVLNDTYDYSTIACKGPEFDSMESRDDQLILHFKNATNGYNRFDGITGFEIAGEDLIFKPADARIDGQAMTVIVSSPEVTAPKAARYCFRNFQIGNLTNIEGLPVIPFRTDN